MTAPCARRLRDRRQASVWLADTAREGCFRYLWSDEPVRALQETMEGVEELARRRTIIRRFGLLFFNRRVDVSPTHLFPLDRSLWLKPFLVRMCAVFFPCTSFSGFVLSKCLQPVL